MGTYESAFQKAVAEGRINKDMFPWEKARPNASALSELEKIYHDLPDQLKQLPFAVLNEFQTISENIRSAAIQKSLNIIGITSPVPRQGTSTLTAILSLIVAAGKRTRYSETIQRDAPNQLSTPEATKKMDFPVLLIDAQLRNPTLHEIFQIKNGKGLFDLLNNNIPFNAVVKEIEIPDLKLITIGENEDYHFVHSHFENFRLLLAEMKNQFEFVFVDIPPVLHYAEGIALSKLCDGIVMVVQAGETRWEVVQEARRALAKADANVIGSILNRREYYIPNWLYRML